MIYDRIWKEARKTGKETLLRRAVAVNNKTKAIGLDAGRFLFKAVTGKLGGRLNTIVSAASAISPAIVRGLKISESPFSRLTGSRKRRRSSRRYPASFQGPLQERGPPACAISLGELKMSARMPTASAKSISAAPTSCSAITKCRKLRLRSWTTTGSNTGDLGFSRSGRMALSHRQKEECHRHEKRRNIYPEEIEIIVNNHPLSKRLYGLCGAERKTAAISYQSKLFQIWKIS